MTRVALITVCSFMVVLSANARPVGGRDQPAAAVRCTESPEFGQLAFWVGDWDVYDGARRLARSRVHVLEGSCALLEEYDQPDGFSGRSLNFFDPALRRWRQTWVDRFGNVSEFTGAADGDGMRLEGRSHRRDGSIVFRTMTLTPLAAGRVRQRSQRSVDEGRTWTLAYDYLYVPTGGSPPMP